MTVKLYCGFDWSLKNHRFWKINGVVVGALALVTSIYLLAKCVLMSETELQTIFQNTVKLKIVCGACVLVNICWLIGVIKVSELKWIS